MNKETYIAFRLKFEAKETTIEENIEMLYDISTITKNENKSYSIAENTGIDREDFINYKNMILSTSRQHLKNILGHFSTVFMNDEEVISSILLMGFEEADRHFKVKYTVTMDYSTTEESNEAIIKIISIE